MFGLDGREFRFAVIISAAHLAQHVFIRLLPPLLPILTVALTYPLWQLGVLVSAYYLGSGLAQAPLGVLSDRYDRLYLLPSGIALSAAGYVVFAVAPLLGASIPPFSILEYALDGPYLVMFVSMVIVGVGTAAVHPVGYPMISANVSEENKGKVLGAFGSSSKVGDGVAPAVVGVLIIVFAWQQILLLFGALGILFGAVLYVVLRDGAYETMPAAVATEGADAYDDTGDHDEDTRDDGDADELGRRSYLYPMTVIYFFFVTKMFASNGVNTFLPAFLVAVYAYSFEIGGLSLGPESVANFYYATLLVFSAATQLMVGGLTDTYDTRGLLIACTGVATAGLLALSFLELSPLPLLFVLVVLAAGLWGLNPARDALISEITPPDREGRTFGYIWTAAMLTGSLIPATVGLIIDAVGMREGFMVLAAGTVFAAATISLLYSDRVYRSGDEEKTNAVSSD